MAQSWKLSDIILSIWLQGKKNKTWNFTLLPLRKIRRMRGGPEAFISSFAGTLMWHLSASLGHHSFHQRKVRLDACRPSQVFGLFTLFKQADTQGAHWGAHWYGRTALLAFEFTGPEVTRSSSAAIWLFDTMEIYGQTRCPISERLFVFEAKQKRFWT